MPDMAHGGNLTQTFRACHMCTFNVAAIFFRGHPYIWRTVVRHDTVVVDVGPFGSVGCVARVPSGWLDARL